MKQNIIETIIGFVVIITAIYFLMFAYNANNKLQATATYILKARFQNVEGIVEGSDVLIAGIKVGSVEKMTLDKESFMAVLELNIDKDIKLPKDSQAAVATGGFLGNKFIALTPGSEDEDFVANDQIKYTQSTINIEALIGKFLYGK